MWPILPSQKWVYVSCVRVQIANIISRRRTSIMAQDLRAGNELPLSLSPGMVIAFKSSQLDLKSPGTPQDPFKIDRMDLDLCNINSDIILRITFLRGKNKVLFNDRADISLLDGWGQEQSVNLSQVDVDRWERSGVTISVHDCSTPSKDQYQILFDLTTMYYFDKRFPGPPINIIYSAQKSIYAQMSYDQMSYARTTNRAKHPLALSILSDPLEVFTYHLDDLPHMEKQAIKSGLWVDLWRWFIIAHETLVHPWQLLLQIH